MNADRRIKASGLGLAQERDSRSGEAMGNMKKYLMVTPYYKEPEQILARCIESVSRQTVACDHILVADGHAADFIESYGVRHIKIDRSQANYGNTPRAIGCLIGISEEYDGIGLLDADNWLEPHHVESCLAAAVARCGDASLCDFVIAKRYFRRADGTVMFLTEDLTFIDTNCYFFLPGSYSALPSWGLMPRSISAIGDHIFTRVMQGKSFIAAMTPTPTVNYHNLWAESYRVLNEPVPEGAKPTVDMSKTFEVLKRKTEREAEIFNRLCGFKLLPLRTEAASSNS